MKVEIDIKTKIKYYMENISLNEMTKFVLFHPKIWVTYFLLFKKKTTKTVAVFLITIEDSR